jgi:hypothetical protein
MTQELNTPLLTQTALPERSLRYLSSVVGKLPPIDRAPSAWYFSMSEDVLAGYEEYRVKYQGWRDSLTELIQLSGLRPETTAYRASVGTLVSLVPDPSPLPEDVPRWWRLTKEGDLVPRRRTKAEKASEISQRFKALHDIPRAVDFLPGMPTDLWTDERVYPVHVRKPGQAVLVFLAFDPDLASHPFEVDNRWSRLKLSMYFALKEYQETWLPKG